MYPGTLGKGSNQSNQNYFLLHFTITHLLFALVASYYEFFDLDGLHLQDLRQATSSAWEYPEL